MNTIALVVLLMLPLLAMGDHPGMSPSIEQVKSQHESKFLSLPGVVSIGIGLTPDGKQTIIVGLDRPNPDTEAKIPATLKGFPVQVQIIGPIQAQ